MLSVHPSKPSFRAISGPVQPTTKKSRAESASKTSGAFRNTNLQSRRTRSSADQEVESVADSWLINLLIGGVVDSRSKLATSEGTRQLQTNNSCASPPCNVSEPQPIIHRSFPSKAVLESLPSPGKSAGTAVASDAVGKAATDLLFKAKDRQGQGCWRCVAIHHHLSSGEVGGDASGGRHSAAAIQRVAPGVVAAEDRFDANQAVAAGNCGA